MKIALELPDFDVEAFLDEHNVKDEDGECPFYDVWVLAEEASRKGGRFGDPNPELVLQLVLRGGVVRAELTSAADFAFACWEKGRAEEFRIDDHVTSKIGVQFCTQRRSR